MKGFFLLECLVASTIILVALVGTLQVLHSTAIQVKEVKQELTPKALPACENSTVQLYDELLTICRRQGHLLSFAVGSADAP